MPIPLRADFDARMVRAAARWSKVGLRPGGFWRWRRFTTARAGPRRRRSAGDAPDRSRLGDEVQRPWAGRAHRLQPPGQPSRLNSAHRAALAAILESGPIPAVHGVGAGGSSTSAKDLRGIPRRRRQADMSRELRAIGYRKLSARPRHHEQAEGAIEDSKNFPARLDEIGCEKGVEPAAIEVWFADEARIGQKNKITRRWAKRGTRPSAPTTNEPARLISSARSAPARKGCSPHHAQMQHGGDEPAPGRNRRSDRAGRTRGTSRRSGRLASVGPARHAAQHHLDPVAGEMSELNPQENVSQFLRDNWLSNRSQILRRRRRPSLRGLEQPRRSTLADHVHRPSQLGPRVLITSLV